MEQDDRHFSKDATEEGFKPISVQPIGAHPWLFRLRCMVDLQLATIAKILQPELANLTGNVLDVGAGQSPWCAWLPDDASYYGLDVGYADQFGMQRHPGITYYDGLRMPFRDSAFDAAICIEVLEHSENPSLLIQEIARVLCPNGILLLTVPWSARQHHLPHDYHRFTKNRLHKILSDNGFSHVEVRERGSDIDVIANKLIVLSIRLARPRPWWKILWSAPLAILCGTLAGIFVLSAHMAQACGAGSKDDPLGFFVKAKRFP